MISKKPVGGWRAIHQGLGSSIIADLPCGDEEPDRPSNRVGYGIPFRIHTDLGPPNQAFSPRRLESLFTFGVPNYLASLF